MSFAGGDHWIGLSDRQMKGTFVWESGQPLSPDFAAYWHTNQPDNIAGTDCVRILKSGELDDDRCSDPKKFVCQKRLRGMYRVRPQNVLLEREVN